MSRPERTVARRTIALYAIGSLGTGGFATLPGLVLVYFLTDTLGVGALFAGALVTIAKIWDVFADPVIGARSDASLVRTGSRRRFMVLGGALLPVFFILTFAVPAALSPAASAVWVLIAFIATATAFSLFQVPYIALPAELADGYDQRTRLLSTRVVVLTLAILLFGAGGPALRSLGGGDARLGYVLMAVVAGLVIGAGMLVSSRVAPRGAPVSTAAPSSIAGNYRDSIAVLRRSQPFRAIVLTFLLQALATGLMLAAAQYVATYVLRSEAAVDILFVALIGPALVFAPIWQLVARRIGKERGFVIASLCFAVATLALLGLFWAPGPWLYVPVGLAGAGYAGMQSLPMAMLPDVIGHDAQRTGRSEAGAFGGVWTAGETTGMALGASALAIVLAASGYVSTTDNAAITQSPAAIAGIVASFSIVPLVVILASLVVFRRYRLRKADVEAAR